MSLVYFIGYEVKDLTSNTVDLFTLEVEPWNSPNLLIPSKFTQCGSEYLLAGLGVLPYDGYLQKTYSPLKTHNMIHYVVNLLLIDAISSSDLILLEFNGQIVTLDELDTQRGTSSTNECGSGLMDLKYLTVVGSISHTESFLDFKIISKISNPLTASFGVKQISFIFANNLTPPPSGFCLRIGSDWGTFLNYECQTPQKMYLLPDGISYGDCDPACDECFGSSANECISSAEGYSCIDTTCFECDPSCGSCSGPTSNECTTCAPGLWLQRNNTCTPSCGLSAEQVQIVDNFMACQTNCASDQFLREDGTCSNTCLPPLVSFDIDDNLFCHEPCDVNKYLYQDNTCHADCPAPLVQENELGVDLCQLPCDVNEYLYQDNTCRSSCPVPLVHENKFGVDLCQLPCKINEFLYPNGICTTECELPLVIKIASGVISCTSPCANPNHFYYEKDQSCRPSCPSPGVVVQNPLMKICSFTALSEEDAKAVNDVKNIIDNTGKAVGIGLLVMSFLSSGSPQMLTLSALVKMLEYIRYMEVLYPPKLDKMLEMSNDSSISFNFISDVPDIISKSFESNPVPGKFAKYETPSSFIVNAWEGMTTLGAILVITGISEVITSSVKKGTLIYNFFNRLRHVTKWDLFLIMLITNVDGVGVYSSLNLRNVHRNISFLSILDFLVCITMNIVIIFVFLKVLYIGINIRRNRYKVFHTPTSLPSPTNLASPTGLTSPKSLPSPTNDHEPKPLDRWKNWEILFRNFKDNSFFHQSFIFFFILRVFLFDIIIGYFFEYPLFQAIAITIMSFLMVSYLIFKRPYIESGHLVKIIGDETIVLIVNICVLCLAIMDENEDEAYDDRARIGNAVITMNVIFNVVAFVHLVFETLVRLVKVYQIFKTSKIQEASFWRRILFVFSEQEGLELEEKPLDDVIPHVKPLKPVKPQKERPTSKLQINTSLHRKLVPACDRNPETPYYIGDSNESPTKASSNAIIDHSISIKDASDNQGLISPGNEYLTRKRSRFTSHTTTIFMPNKSKSFMNNIDNIYEISLDEKNQKEDFPSIANIPVINGQIEHQKSQLSQGGNIGSLIFDQQKTPDSSFSGSPSDSFVENFKRKPKHSLRKTLLAHRLKRLVQEAGMDSVSQSSRSENILQESEKESSPIEIRDLEKDSIKEKEDEKEESKDIEKEKDIPKETEKIKGKEEIKKFIKLTSKFSPI